MAGKIALGIVIVFLAIQGWGWADHQMKLAGCAEAYKHGNSSWAAYDPSCVAVWGQPDGIRHQP